MMIILTTFSLLYLAPLVSLYCNDLGSRGLQGAGGCLWSCLSFNVLLNFRKRKKENPRKTHLLLLSSCLGMPFVRAVSSRFHLSFVSHFVCIQLAIKPSLPLCFTLAAIKLCCNKAVQRLPQTNFSICCDCRHAINFSVLFCLEWEVGSPQCRPPQRNKASIRVMSHQYPLIIF